MRSRSGPDPCHFGCLYISTYGGGLGKDFIDTLCWNFFFQAQERISEQGLRRLSRLGMAMFVRYDVRGGCKVGCLVCLRKMGVSVLPATILTVLREWSTRPAPPPAV